jgi:hypothetical protein
MSAVYFSWQTAAGLADAGKVEAPGALRGTGLDVDALLSGRTLSAVQLEAPVAACLRRRLEAGADDDARLALEQLLYLLISRPPGQDVLVCQPRGGEDFRAPTLLDWLLPAQGQYPTWPEARKQRVNLLLQLQQAIDTETDEPGRDAALLACLELLSHFPPA